MSPELVEFYKQLDTLGLDGAVLEQWGIADSELNTLCLETDYIIYRKGSDQYLHIEQRGTSSTPHLYSLTWQPTINQWIRVGGLLNPTPNLPQCTPKQSILLYVEHYKSLPNRWLSPQAVDKLADLPIRCAQVRALQTNLTEYALIYADVDNIATDDFEYFKHTVPLGFNQAGSKLANIPAAHLPQGRDAIDIIQQAYFTVSAANELHYKLPSIIYHTTHTGTINKGDLSQNMQEFSKRLIQYRINEFSELEKACIRAKSTLTLPAETDVPLASDMELL